MARQRKDESPQEFADRCRNLARKIVPQVEDPVAQKLYYEQAERMLASYTSGLTGSAGRQVRISLPESMEQALKTAVTVYQTELQRAA